MACNNTKGFNPDPEVSRTFTDMWDLDDKCHHGNNFDYVMNLQGQVESTSSVEGDNAKGKLFTWVDEKILNRKPTYKALKDLLECYEADVEVEPEESKTQERRHLQWVFLESCMVSPTMRAAHDKLSASGLVPFDWFKWEHVMYDTWFRPYKSRTSGRLTSTFKDVFVGDKRGDKLIGLHNWVQIHLQEQAGNLDYHGYIEEETRTELDDIRLLGVQFSWKGLKAEPRSTVFVGCSPAFELAAYTVCMFMDKDNDGKVDVQMRDLKIEVHVNAFWEGKHRKVDNAFMCGARIEQ